MHLTACGFKQLMAEKAQVLWKGEMKVMWFKAFGSSAPHGYSLTAPPCGIGKRIRGKKPTK